MKDFKYTEEQKQDIIKSIQTATNDGYTDNFIVNGHQLEEMFYLLGEVQEFIQEYYFPQIIKELEDNKEFISFFSKLQYRLSEIEKDRLRSGQAAA
jgi:hypothetical protein